MKKAIGLAPAGLVAAVAFAVGAGSMWTVDRRAAADDILALALAHELEVAGLCANSLSLNSTNDHGRLTQLLEQRLDSAVADAARLTTQGARLGIAAPNLRESVRRAASHYAEAGRVEQQERAEALLAALKTDHD
jgi:hypothetical protein